MPLKLSLKPHEKFVLNGAVLMNGDRRASLVIENKASILREKDIMQSEQADTPIKRIYFPIMMMYLDADASQAYYEEFVIRMTEFMNAISNRDASALCVEISRDVLQGQYYRALMKCRKLFEFEQQRLTYVLAGLPEDAASV
jgi:flagellar protein FlbT